MNFDKEAKSDKKKFWGRWGGWGWGGGGGGGGVGGGWGGGGGLGGRGRGGGCRALKPKQYARLCQMR